MKIENTFNFVPGIGEKTEQKLWKNGVTHWDDIESTDRISSNKRKKAREFIGKARKNLEVGNEAFFGKKVPNRSYWRMYENFSDSVAFFDIETTGLDERRNKVTTVSIYRNGESRTLVRGQDLTEERLKEEFFESSLIVSFNGKRFDQPFLEHNYDLQIKNPHIDLMYLCKRVGLTGGLKKVEKDLGIDRGDLDDVDGREAVRLWKRYERHDDEEALEKLVHYNQLDAENLQNLLETVHDRLAREVFEKHVSSSEDL
jgi:uncharacterized protein YprB with RNaseH-like and TPR domain